MNSPTNQGVMRLYDRQNNRLYINADERLRFTSTAEKQNDRVRILCLVLAFTGCRISEALELTSDRILGHESLIVFRTLKTHGRHAFREVPVPASLIVELLQLATGCDSFLWSKADSPLNRITAYRWIINQNDFEIRRTGFNILDEALQCITPLDAEPAFARVGIGAHDLHSAGGGVGLYRFAMVLGGIFLMLGRHAHIFRRPDCWPDLCAHVFF